MLTYIYHNVDDCWLTSSMPQQRFKLHISLNYAQFNKIRFLEVFFKKKIYRLATPSLLEFFVDI